jgi:hypothetical protein
MMLYREKQYSVVQGIDGGWKWSIELGDGRRKSGSAHSRPEAIRVAQQEIDRALAPKKVKLVPPARPE